MSSLGPPPPDGDRDQAAAIMVPQTIVGAIAFTFFGTRLYVRARIVRKLWWDDVLISLGMVGHWDGSKLSVIKLLMHIQAIIPHSARHKRPRNTLRRGEARILHIARSPISSPEMGDSISIPAGRLYHVHPNVYLPLFAIGVWSQRQVAANLPFHHRIYRRDQRPGCDCDLGRLQPHTKIVVS